MTDDEIRARLTAALGNLPHVIEALLPLVRAIAAEELRAAAESLVRDGRPDLTTVAEVDAVNQAAQVLDDRADALAPRPVVHPLADEETP